MTSREEEIFSLIQKQPLISQSEIADQLNIARSSVAVYISSMIKKGIIQGRGYILNSESQPSSYVCVIGTAAIDFIGEIDEFPDPEIINLYESPLLLQRYGGTAKNTAEVLSFFGIKSQMIAALGKDIWGQNFVQDCKQHLIGTDGCIEIDGSPTDMYWEIRSKCPKKIIMRLANCKLRSHITPDVLNSRRRLITESSAIVVEDGLPLDSILHIIKNVNHKMLILETTDPANRGKRIAHLLPSFPGIVTSTEYLCQTYNLLQPPVEYNIAEATRIAGFLYKMNIRDCLFTFGSQYLCYLYHGRLYFSDVHFSDGNEHQVYKRFQFGRACIIGTYVFCRLNNDSPETMLRKISISRHHAALSEHIVPSDLSPSVFSNYYNKMDDHLQVISLTDN